MPQTAQAIPSHSAVTPARITTGILPWVLIFLLGLPSLTIAVSLFGASGEGLQHLADTVLGRYVSNALLLLVGVSVISFILGTVSAWLITMYQFPGRTLLSWTLILPVSMPAYVLAMLYGYLLNSSGPVQDMLRQWLDVGYGEYWFPSIYSTGGAIFALSITNYTYAYLLSRMAFEQQSCQLIDSARMLGISGARLFLRIGVPIARPAIVVAMALIGMETLADFGTVSLFGVESFTTGIYRTWFGMADPGTAAKLSAMLLVCVMTVLLIERHFRKQARFFNATGLYHPLPKTTLHGLRAWGASLFCLLPVLLGFVIPFALLVFWSVVHHGFWQDSKTWTALLNAIYIAAATVIIVLAIALYFTTLLRRNPPHALSSGIAIATSGYAIPGPVIAVGLLIPLLWLDKHLADMLGTGLLLTGTMVAVVFACTVRFLAVGMANVESGMQHISPMMDDACRMLGRSPFGIFLHVHLPMIKGSLLTAGILVFVDVMKELPATMMLRPFNFDTLAIRTYELARDEQLIAAASPALLMVLASLIPIFLLNRQFEKSRPGT